MKVYCHFSLFRFPLSILYLLFILLLGTSSEEELKSLLKKVKVESEKVGLKLNIQKTKIMASGPTTSWEIDGETVETVTDFIFSGSKITADGDCSHEIKRRLLLGRTAMTNLHSTLKHRDITLPTNVHLVKAMVFPVVMYGCESWTIKKAECQRLDAFELWCWRRLSSLLDSKEIKSAKSLQSCPTLCNPIDSSLPGSPVPGILQARTLEWVAISFFNA